MDQYLKIINQIAPQHSKTFIMEAVEHFSKTLLEKPDQIQDSDMLPESFKEIAQQITEERERELNSVLDDDNTSVPPFGPDDNENIPWAEIEKNAIRSLED